MAGTPPARPDLSQTTPSAAPLSAPRIALEALPLPFLIFEPSLRLNFINASARRFFNLEHQLRIPEPLGFSASDLFGEDVQFRDDDDPAPGDSFEYGEWNERIRMLECRRRNKPDSPPVATRAAVTPFIPGSDYFGAPSGSNGIWYSVMLLSSPASPVSSSASTATPGAQTPADRAPRRDVRSAYSQFAASAQARQPVILRDSPHSRGSILSPGARSARTGQLPVVSPAGSFFPTTPASTASGGSSGSSSSMAALSSYAPSLTESVSHASTADSTAPSVGDAEAPSITKRSSLPPVVEPAMPTPVRPPPPPSRTSPAAAIIEQSRALDKQRERERESREQAEEEERREALSRKEQPSPPAVVPGSRRASLQDALLLPDGTAASLSSPSLDPAHPLTVLTHAALSHLPRTGIILASKDLSGGYVNDMARELLLGVKPKPAPEDDENGWMEDGIWIAQPGPGGRWTWDGAEFFRGLDSNAPITQEAADETERASAGRPAETETTSTTGGDITIGLPTQLYRMTVATILQRSQKLSKARRKALRQRSRPSSDAGASAAALLDGLRQDDAQSGPASTQSPRQRKTSIPKVQSLAAPSMSEAAPAPAVEAKQTRKPYKVYDATFYQRIIDPLEPLLEMCARKGEEPDSSLGGHVGLVVGLEVDVAENSGFANDTFETPSVGQGKRRVRRRLVEIKGAVVRHPNGTHLGGMLVLRDVTDEKATEGVKPRTSLATLARDGQQDAYFKQILDQMPQMVWTTTPQGSHDYFNNQWYEYTGLEPEQSLGLGWQNPFHDDDMPHTIKAWSHSLATGDPYSVEYRCRRFDGSWRWMLGRALPMRDSEGKVTGWFGTCTDIEDAVNIRAELLRTREQFISVLSSADVTIISTDANFNIELVEGSDADMFRQDNEELPGYGRSFREIWPSDTRTDEQLDGVASGKLLTGRCESRGPNGLPYRLMCRAREERGQDGLTRKTGFTIVANNIGDLKDAEKALEQSAVERTRLITSEAAAKEASRLKTAWLANTTHEVRTPISAMVGLAELLLDDPKLAPEHRELVERIVRSCEILLEMVGMVLDMGKVEAGKLEIDEHEFWLNQLLADVRIFSHTAQRKGLVFREETTVTYNGPLHGDMPRLRQILGNMLSNAIKFTSEGSVTLRTTSSEETDDSITILFTIIDTGIGIKKEAQASLFQPFHQADASTARKFGGTGLGLSITKSLIQLMGGTVSMKSVYQQGTTMEATIRFRKLAERAQTPPSAEQAQEDPGKTINRAATRILLAEDNELNRDIAVKLLQRLGFQVDSVTNGFEALAAMEQQVYDLVLMDGQMPDLDGYETTRRLRESDNPAVRDIKVVALTASALQGERERCIEAGMDDYIAKPVRLRELEAVVIKNLVATIKTPPALASAPTPGLASAHHLG